LGDEVKPNQTRRILLWISLLSLVLGSLTAFFSVRDTRASSQCAPTSDEEIVVVPYTGVVVIDLDRPVPAVSMPVRSIDELNEALDCAEPLPPGEYPYSGEPGDPQSNPGPPPDTTPLVELATSEFVKCNGITYLGGTRCPEPSGAVWATSRSGNAIQVSGSGSVISGAVHSEAGISVGGAGNKITGSVNSVLPLTVSGAGNVVTPRAAISIGGIPAEYNYISNLFGGATAVRAGAENRLITLTATDCPNGTATLTSSSLQNGFVYQSNACVIVVSGAGLTRSVTFIAEKGITISAAGLTLSPAFPGYVSIYSGAAAKIQGANLKIDGRIHSAGAIEVSGSGAKLCGLVGKTVLVTGATARVAACP
jgi:cytoskeletal protein CcmA (bactofilin family)